MYNYKHTGIIKVGYNNTFIFITESTFSSAFDTHERGRKLYINRDEQSFFSGFLQFPNPHFEEYFSDHRSNI